MSVHKGGGGGGQKWPKIGPHGLRMTPMWKKIGPNMKCVKGILKQRNILRQVMGGLKNV